MRRDRTGIGIGLFFVAAGTLFLLGALDVLEVRAAFLWPLLLIGFGAALLMGGVRRARGPEPGPPAVARPAPAPLEEPPPHEPPPPEEPPTRDEPGHGMPAPDDRDGEPPP